MFIMLETKSLTDVIREWSEVFMQRSMRDFKRFMDVSGLSFSQINILMRLVHSGDTSVSEVGEQLGFSNAAASQAVDRLVGMGLIHRTEDPEDRRSKQLTLTIKGHDMIDKAIVARSQWIEGLAESLNPEQQNTIIFSLTLLTEAARKTNE
jgi:DNA-binding MarR family transcriptional regulator